MGKVVIFGAGNVGKTLLSILEERKHKITIVEDRREICDEIATETSASVVHGDSTEPTLLDELELEEVDYVFAVTGSEEANFLCGAYAKQAGAKKVICRVNSPKHTRLLEKMGVESVVPEFTLAVELANRISSPVIHKLLNPLESKLELVEREADKKMVGQNPVDATNGKNFLIIAVYKDGRYKLAKETEKIPKDSTLILLKERGFKLI